MGSVNSVGAAQNSDSDSETIDYTYLAQHWNKTAMDKIDTDAAITIKTQQQLLPKVLPIKSEQILEIKEKLALYEKISIVFLLAETHEAFEIMLKLTKFENTFTTFLSTFLHHEPNKDKFIEALCAIQNYEILKFLGYKKDQAQETYFPLKELAAIHINKIRKLLYRISETLTEKETKLLLDSISKDISENYPQLSFPTFDYLEIYFAYLFMHKYASEDDLSNIIKHFKSLELDFYADLLKTSQSRKVHLNVSERYSFGEPPNVVNTDQTTANVGDIGGIRRNRLKVDDTDVYKMNEFSPGICLIIENIFFYEDFNDEYKKLVIPSETVIGSREGSKCDSARLTELFQRFGYTVIHKSNLKHFEMLEVIRETAYNKIKDKDSSFVLILLSHGIEHQIIGSNSVPLDVSDIKKAINSKVLEGKPKIFIFQSCQGSQIMKIQDDDVTTDSPKVLNSSQQPCERHIIELWATVPGYASFRSKKTGSWMIQLLCDVLETHNEESFADICARVQKKIGERKWGVSFVMVTNCVTTLDKKLFLPPLKPIEGKN